MTTFSTLSYRFRARARAQTPLAELREPLCRAGVRDWLWRKLDIEYLTTPAKAGLPVRLRLDRAGSGDPSGPAGPGDPRGPAGPGAPRGP
ncbi:MAG: hypothetical protein ABI333_01210, partial [bacterium]